MSAFPVSNEVFEGTRGIGAHSTRKEEEEVRLALSPLTLQPHWWIFAHLEILDFFWSVFRNS